MCGYSALLSRLTATMPPFRVEISCRIGIRVLNLSLLLHLMINVSDENGNFRQLSRGSPTYESKTVQTGSYHSI